MYHHSWVTFLPSCARVKSLYWCSTHQNLAAHLIQIYCQQWMDHGNNLVRERLFLKLLLHSAMYYDKIYVILSKRKCEGTGKLTNRKHTTVLSKNSFRKLNVNQLNNVLTCQTIWLETLSNFQLLLTSAGHFKLLVLIVNEDSFLWIQLKTNRGTDFRYPT